MKTDALSCLVAASSALSWTAQAQTAGGDIGTLEEIVVTAQKRIENIQDVPIAITAF